MVEKPLENIPVEPFRLPVHREADNSITVVAMIAYIPHGPDPGDWEIFAIRPRKKSPNDKRPFELAKGKRLMQEKDGTWRSIRSGDDITGLPPKRLEELARTGYRESMQESGLRLSNVASACDAGDYYLGQVAPAVMRGMPAEEPRSHMRVIAVTLHDPRAWDACEDKVAECVRMPLRQFLAKGRLKQTCIAEQAMRNVRKHVYSRAELLELERAYPHEGGYQGR